MSDLAIRIKRVSEQIDRIENAIVPLAAMIEQEEALDFAPVEHAVRSIQTALRAARDEIRKCSGEVDRLSARARQTQN